MKNNSSLKKSDKISDKKKLIKYYYIYVLLKILILYILLFNYINYEYLKDLKKFIKQITLLYNHFINQTLIYDKEIEQYIYVQNDFCDNPSKYFKKEIEDKIILVNVSIIGLSYQMYIYKKQHFMTKIMTSGSYEKKETINMLNALQYYSRIKNIFNNKEIFIIDIGGHTGWYPSFFGRLGYSILSFEPLETNYYILRKNYCLLNRYSNIIIITKGINNKEMICDYYKNGNNMGNGMILCNKKNISFINSKYFQKLKQVTLVKLKRYIPYLINKNIALIKLDIEGNEAKALESGIELITVYKVPFIFIEFTPAFLIEHQNNPSEFLDFFIKNGYKISMDGFLSNNYISIEEIMKKVRLQVNLYFTHNSISKLTANLP